MFSKIISKIKTFKLYVIIMPLKLGSGLFNKLKLSIVSFFLLFFGNLAAEIKLRFEEKQFKFNFRKKIDLNVIKEVFVDKDYYVSDVVSPAVIFDLGANVGVSVIYFKLKFPEAMIVAIEPDPGNFLRLKENTKDFNKIIYLNCAVSDKNGEAFLNIDLNSHASSSLSKRFKNTRSTKVQTRTLDSIADELKIEKIDLLKFDIEGAELDVFKSFKQLSKVKNIIGEVHFDLINKTQDDFLYIFRDFSIKMTEIKGNKRYIIKAKNKYK